MNRKDMKVIIEDMEAYMHEMDVKPMELMYAIAILDGNDEVKVLEKSIFRDEDD